MKAFTLFVAVASSIQGTAADPGTGVLALYYKSTLSNPLLKYNAGPGWIEPCPGTACIPFLPSTNASYPSSAGWWYVEVAGNQVAWVETDGSNYDHCLGGSNCAVTAPGLYIQVNGAVSAIETFPAGCPADCVVPYGGCVNPGNVCECSDGYFGAECSSTCPTGSNGEPCSGHGSCSQAQPSCECESGWSTCSGNVCGVDTSDDPNNCGACGSICKADPGAGISTATCANSTCLITCESGYISCPLGNGSDTCVKGSVCPALPCNVEDPEKVDCGFSGVNEQQCEAKGCCWLPSNVSNIPWCFYKAGTSTNCFGVQPTLSLPFSESEVTTMRGYFLANINIQGKGGIVASPDTNTPGGSYYYHWMRDGALTMRCLQETAAAWSDVETIVKAYVGWVVNNMMEADPNGIDVRAEPKFNLPNGDVFTSGWCRPQNDGPGLRAYALILAANQLIAAGETAYVQQYLWTGNQGSYNGGAIKYNLDYIAGGYNSTTCDLWEEIRSTDLFWNRITMKKALIAGATFAKAMGDTNSAASYMETMEIINSTLYATHWTGAYYEETNTRTRDSAVIVGLNDGYDVLDGMFEPTSTEVAMTVGSYNTLFCSEYAVNTNDTNSGLPGVLYGRYGGDSYAGGNPWVLSTAALGSLFYRAAISVLQVGVPNATAIAAWETAINVTSLPTTAPALAAVFAAQGDGVLLRLRAHVISNQLHLDEQIDRNTGVQLSATDLTWSYAEVLNAMRWRGIYVGLANNY
jgi:glucoamylase